MNLRCEYAFLTGDPLRIGAPLTMNEEARR